MRVAVVVVVVAVVVAVARCALEPILLARCCPECKLSAVRRSQRDLTGNVETYARVDGPTGVRARRTAPSSSSDDRRAYAPRNFRGQTQSQYLSYAKHGDAADTGKAEAESTHDGTRAVVATSGGMGQAQSQSGVGADCGGCVVGAVDAFGGGDKYVGGRVPFQQQQQRRPGAVGPDGRATGAWTPYQEGRNGGPLQPPGVYRPGAPPGQYTNGAVNGGDMRPGHFGDYRPGGGTGDYRPGDYRPGDYRPGVGDLRPGIGPGDPRPVGGNGDYKPGDYRPGDYRPGDHRPGDYRPGVGDLRPGIGPGDLRPAVGNGDLRPVGGNGDYRPGDHRPGVGNMRPGVVNGDLRPVGGNGDYRPGDYRPGVANGDGRPGVGNGYPRPGVGNGDLRPGGYRPGDYRPGDYRPGVGDSRPGPGMIDFRPEIGVADLRPGEYRPGGMRPAIGTTDGSVPGVGDYRPGATNGDYRPGVDPGIPFRPGTGPGGGVVNGDYRPGVGVGPTGYRPGDANGNGYPGPGMRPGTLAVNGDVAHPVGPPHGPGLTVYGKPYVGDGRTGTYVRPGHAPGGRAFTVSGTFQGSGHVYDGEHPGQHLIDATGQVHGQVTGLRPGTGYPPGHIPDGQERPYPLSPGQGTNGYYPGVGPGYAPGLGPGYAPGQGPGFGPGQGPGLGPGQVPGFGPGFAPGQGPGFGPGQGPGFGPGQGPGFGPGQGPGFGPGQGPGFGPGQGPGFGPGQGPGFGPGQGPAFGPGQGPGFGPGQGPGFGPGQGPGFGPGFGPGQGPGFGPGQGPGFGPGFGPGQGPGFGPMTIYDPAYGTDYSCPGQMPCQPGAGPVGHLVQNGHDTTDADADSQVQTSVQQTDKGTESSASASGRYAGGTAHAQVSGTYAGSGSFNAQAGTADASRAAQTQVSGGKEGASSSAQGRGGKGKSQAEVQLNSESGATSSNAMSGGVNQGTNTQVQAGNKGGMADAQASGIGHTSSQAQIGFQPYNEERKDDDGGGDVVGTPFRGGGTASAQGGTYTGQSQSQITGKFRYGISYTGAAQAGSGTAESVDRARNQDRPHSLIGYAAGNSSMSDFTGFVPPDRSKPDDARPTPVAATYGEDDGHDGHTKPDPADRFYVNARPHDTESSVRSSKHTPSKVYPQPESDPATTLTPPDDDDDDYEYEEDDYESTVPPELVHKMHVIDQSGPKQSQSVDLGPLEDIDAHVVQDADGALLREGALLMPGQSIPGSPGYVIPQGFRGRVTSTSGGVDAVARGGASQAQSVRLTSPGVGRIAYGAPPTARRVVDLSRGRTTPVGGTRDAGDSFVTVTKSIAGEIGGGRASTDAKKYTHTYYTKSSTCGYFTFSCNIVYGTNGRTKICRPKAPTNPDGTPMQC